MNLLDIMRFSGRASLGYPARTLLMLLAMAIGVASIVLLSTLGEGARSYVVGQFSSLGTNLLIVLPGRSETIGGPPPLLGVTPRDLTLQDATALHRSSVIRYVAPIILGAAPVSHGRQEREVTILGSTWQLQKIRQLSMEEGRFLSEADIDRAAPVCVFGATAKNELFGNKQAVGKKVRISDMRFRVGGVIAAKGESVGIDMSDVVIVPVASAQTLFNTQSLFRIMIEATDRGAIAKAKKAIIRIIKERHNGEDDVTVITQDAVLTTFDKIFTALTLTVSGVAAISVGVAGVLIMNVMLIAVSQRRAEVGLLKAIGASNHQIVTLFLAESALLSLMGGAMGILVALGGVRMVDFLYPQLPLATPFRVFAIALGVSLGCGLIFGVLPALRAARLDPVQSLSRR